MKKSLLYSYVDGVCDKIHGESYKSILRYLMPEFVTALVIYSAPLLIDAIWIATLCSTSSYATLGITNTLLHAVIKIAEAVSVGTVIMVGQLNGSDQYERAGESLVVAFWTTVFFGFILSSCLYFGAPFVYYWYQVPNDVIMLGIPFLQVRAFSIFFTFVYFALIGFLRGIKNTHIPMKVFVVGAFIFLLFDYLLIFGKCGFPTLQLMGSAYASVIQYGSMCVIAFVYLIYTKSLQVYNIRFFSFDYFSWSRIYDLIQLSWPVIIDKATIAFSYVWLSRCLIADHDSFIVGTALIASFSVIKDLERFALLPAIACAQVVTFLVSNDYKIQKWDAIKSNVKKIIFLSSCMVFSILFVCVVFAKDLIRIFDLNSEFTYFASQAFPMISVLVFFDLLQLILAGALRGAANVKVVMLTRLIICFGFFIPLSYFFSLIPTINFVLKFVLIYSSFYVGNALMSIMYIRRFRGEAWKNHALKDSV